MDTIKNRNPRKLTKHPTKHEPNTKTTRNNNRKKNNTIHPKIQKHTTNHNLQENEKKMGKLRLRKKHKIQQNTKIPTRTTNKLHNIPRILPPRRTITQQKLQKINIP